MKRLALLIAFTVPLSVAAARPTYLWIEAERFRDVEGQFIYWTGAAKPTGRFGIAGPGVSAEWSQGGESEWSSIGVPAEEKSARAWRDVRVPHAGRWRVWVRAVDHRDRSEPFTVSVEQAGASPIRGVLGLQPSVPRNDEYELYWSFSFGWSSVEGTLDEGPAKIALTIDREGQAWRQIDAVVLTDDLAWQPVGREKPPFAYFDAFAMPGSGALGGNAAHFAAGASWKRPPVGGDDFAMWTNVASTAPAMQSKTLYDLYFESTPTISLQAAFKKELAGRRDLPILSWPRLRPVFLLSSDLSPGAPVRAFLDRTRTPFAILTNYQNPTLGEAAGAATFRAYSEELRDRFLGFIFGETFGTVGVGIEDRKLAADRRSHADAFADSLILRQQEAWKKMLHAEVPASFFSTGIACLSSDLGNALTHLLRQRGQRLTGYEEDSSVVHVPLKLMFQRGAARQFGGAFINYASGNFGDACNYFWPTPPVASGTGNWFHSKYSITDGVTIGWYRKLYYLNYLGGASAVYWEQGLNNQFMKPGPGKHPIELSPFGRVTKDFLDFVDRTPDRGEPYTPVAVLLSYGHGYSHVSFRARPFEVFDESADDLELRELFNVLYFPSPVLEGKPQAPDVQSLPSGVFGNIFDALVDRPERAAALYDYPVVWLAGDVKLGAPFRKTIDEHLRRGGTWVLTSDKLGELPAELTGVERTGRVQRASQWQADGAGGETAPFDVDEVKLGSAKVVATAGDRPLIVRNAVGAGAVVTLLVPHGIGLDERAHPAAAWLANGLFRDLLPVQVRRGDGTPLEGDALFQISRTRRGWLVLLVNNRGVDKTQNGLPRVDRRAAIDLLVRTALPVKSARELTAPEPVSFARGELRVTISPGDLKVIELITK